MFWKRKPPVDEEFERTPLPPPQTFQDWSFRFTERASQFTPLQDSVTFKFKRPTTIALIADLHVGSPNTHYGQIEAEVEHIYQTPNMHVIYAGDEIDNLFFRPGVFEAAEQTPEQLSYLFAMFDYLAKRNKILHRIGGDHDGWLMKQGYDLSREMGQRWNASFNKGAAYFTIHIGDTIWRMGGAHQLPGHSIYNNNHKNMRAIRFGSMHGSDVVFSGHNHKKGIAMDFQHEFGVPHRTHYIALGPYKGSDSWLRKKGWAVQQPLEMFGCAVTFGHDKITVHENILEV